MRPQMRFSPSLAAEDVHVEVHDGLTGVDALVGDDAETVLQTLGLGDLLDGVGHGAMVSAGTLSAMSL